MGKSLVSCFLLTQGVECIRLATFNSVLKMTSVVRCVDSVCRRSSQLLSFSISAVYFPYPAFNFRAFSVDWVELRV